MTARDDEELYAFRTNMVVTASAGTGKTFRLVTLYVLLTLGLTSKDRDDDSEAAPPVAPSRIAATTFSRAAAAEIRERVERVLRAVATGSYDESTEAYRAVLASRAERTGSDVITSSVMRERARAALIELPSALVDTLHGLAARIVRASALDLGMTPAYDVLDEDGARVSVDAAVEEGLTDALARGDRAASDLLDACGGLAMTRRKIGELLDRADEEGLRIEELAHTDFAEAANESMKRLRTLCLAVASDASRPLAEPARAAGAAVERWLSADAEGQLGEKDLARALEPLFERRSPARPTPAEEDFFAFRAAVRGETNAARARRLAAFAARAHALSPRTRAMGALLSDIARRRSVERRRSGALGFGDLLSIARDAVRDHPALAEVARGMFDVLLVDEFQDTSRVQRDLVYLLRERPERAKARVVGALPEAADLAPAGLLVVGDRKQSIYGFRGADVTVFARVCAELAGRRASEALRLVAEFDVPETPNATLISLIENRRSDRRILEFVNRFAEQDFDERSPYPFDIRYAESEHLVPASNVADHPGLPVAPRVVVVDDSNETPVDLPPLVRTASGPIREALVAAGVVDRAVRDGEFGHLSFGDVAILARRRSTLPLVEMALARLDIPYVVAGRGLFDTREVRDVFALLRLMLDPYDRHALATVLRGPAVALGDCSLALLSDAGRGLAPPDEWFRAGTGVAARLAEDEQERLRGFASRFSELRRVGVGLGPADAIRYATEKVDLDRVVAALPHAAQRLGNVERLVSIATSRGGSLTGFVRWLDKQIDDEADESEAASLETSDDAVTLMTIHASKGLEFKAVVLADMGAAVRAQPLTLALLPARHGRPARLAVRHVHERGGSLYTPEAVELAKENTARELAERRRLTYVAMTRAKERLFLLLPGTPANGSAGATLRRMLRELPLSPSASPDDGFRIESALSFLRRPPRNAEAPLRSSAEAETRVNRAAIDQGPLGIPTTALALFEQCERRYRLVHELSVEPPPFRTQEVSEHGRDNRRTLGTAAHRVLERWPLSRFGAETDHAEVMRELVREGFRGDDPGAQRVAGNVAAFLGSPYAKRAGAAGAVVYREEPFVVPVASDRGTLLLRGTIDLLVVLADGSAEIVDYKSSWRPDLASYGFQLHAYGLAARRRYGASSVKVGLLNLAVAHEPTLTELPASELTAFEARLGGLRARFSLARASGDFRGVERPRCEALRCGFVGACHGG